LCYNI